MDPSASGGKEKKSSTNRRSKSVGHSTKEYATRPTVDLGEYERPPTPRPAMASVAVVPNPNLIFPHLSQRGDDSPINTANDDMEDVITVSVTEEERTFVRIENVSEGHGEDISRGEYSTMPVQHAQQFAESAGAVGGAGIQNFGDHTGGIVGRSVEYSLGKSASSNAMNPLVEINKFNEIYESERFDSLSVRDDRIHQSLRGNNRRTIVPASHLMSPPRVVVDQAFGENPNLYDYFQDPATVTNDKRAMFINGLERLWSNTQSPNFPHLKVQHLDVQVETANNYWNNFLREHCEAYTKTSTPQQRAAVNKLHSRMENLHQQIVSTLTIRADELRELARRAERRQEHPNRHGHLDTTVSELQMRAVKMESFSGDYMQWTVFKSFFENYYHNATITDSMKMYMLRSYLVKDSEPYNLISGFEATAENYNIAWQLLCGTYDDERKILEAHFLAFLDMPKVDQNPTRRALMDLVTKTRTLLNSMPKYGVDTSHWGVCIVPILMRKLDNASKSDWSMKRPQRVKPEIEPLLQFIARRAEGIDQSFTGVPQGHNISPHNEAGASDANAGNASANAAS